MTQQPLPVLDPAYPDPLNAVNVTVINTPNARSEGARGWAALGWRAALGAWRWGWGQGVRGGAGAGASSPPFPALLIPLQALRPPSSLDALSPPPLFPLLLPPPEMLIDLPLAYFVPPINPTAPGQLAMVLDLEQKR